MIVAALLLAQAAPAGAWAVADGRARVAAADISLPTAAGGLTLVETGEASQKGSGVDDVAEYRSADGAVRGTAFVFRPAYADTALASWQLGRVMAQRYGAATRLGEMRAMAVDGHADALLRARYDGAVAAGQPIATTSGFVRASSWLIGLRVTAPAARQAEVATAFDALAAGLRFGAGLHVYAAAPLVVTGACPPAAEHDAAPMASGREAGAQLLGAAMAGGSLLVDLPPKPGKPPTTIGPAFPRNGLDQVCVRGTVTGVPLLQPAGEAEPAIVLGVLDDAGGTIAWERALIGSGYLVSSYGIAAKRVRGGWTGLPSLDQMTRLMTGADAAGAKIRASVTTKPGGGTDISVDPGVFR